MFVKPWSNRTQFWLLRIVITTGLMGVRTCVSIATAFFPLDTWPRVRYIITALFIIAIHVVCDGANRLLRYSPVRVFKVYSMKWSYGYGAGAVHTDGLLAVALQAPERQR